MICKNCGQQMPDVGAFCPFCAAPKEIPQEETVTEVAEQTEVLVGEETDIPEGETAEEGIEEEMNGEETEEEFQEEEPRRKLKPWQIIAIVLGGIVLLGVLVGAVLYGLGVDLKPRKNDLYAKDSYTASDEKVEKSADTVIATLGDKELTIGALQLYYTNDIYNFVNQYYSSMGYVPMDLALPLEEQNYPVATGEEQTWQQYFLDTALRSWQTYALLETLMEQDSDYTISEEMQAQIDGMEAEIDSLATAYGYATAQEYLDEMMTPGITLQTYMDFNRSYYMANAYLEYCQEQFIPTDDEIMAYYEQNKETFAANGVEPNIGLQSSVRHILIQPEGGTTDENNVTTYSDEEKAAAYAEAERILQEWKSGEATEESFAQLANTYSKDGGSNTTGGLYEGINIDASYVAEFREWAVDASRKTGDTSIVETQFGYHIMYFVSGEDYFTVKVSDQLVIQRVQDMLIQAQQEYPAKINYKKIKLYTPAFG